MLGAAPPPSAPQPAEPAAVASAPMPAGDPSFGEVPGLPRRKGRTPWAILILVGFLLVAGGIGAYVFLGMGPDVRASIGQSESGEALLVDVPDAAEGTKVRFNGQEHVLAAGRASFALAANDLQLGDNELSVDVIAPDGSSQQATVVLSLAYRVRADLSALEEDPAQLRIVVDATPGSTVTLDEQAVTLDGTGHGRLSFPLEGGDGAVYERTVHYRVVTGEAPAEGEVQVRVPFASLQIDRPGSRTVTDRESIELAGAAPASATVTVDGNPLEVREGRFLGRIELSELGESEHVVVAREPGRAPRTRTLTIRRVADLAAEAAAYEVDRSLTYTHIAQNPDSYRGQRVAFEGRVYNVDVHEGRSVMQIVARQCPAGQRCPLWVTFDGASEAELNTWVRVVGEIAGEQQFRSPSGQVLSVPRVDAVFVLPAEAEPQRRRRRRRRR
ncbi:MAG: hypothetical protein AAGE52_10145 [Myxococcota bacterium]